MPADNKHRLKIVLFSLFGFFVLLAAGAGLLFYTGTFWRLRPDGKTFQLKGLDVSRHQGIIDWQQVSREYTFVFIKATEGDDFLDTQFQSNLAGARATKRLTGAYHYFHFNYKGIDQANNFIKVVGNSIDLSPVVDVEFSGNPKNFAVTTVKKELAETLRRLQEFYQLKPIIYTTYDAYDLFIKNQFDNPIWLRSIIFPVDKNFPRLAFWQYQNKAKVAGIKELVDLNAFKGTKQDIRQYCLK